MGLIIIGCARLSRSYIQIKNFLNSYRAGAHSNSVTLEVSALFSEGPMQLIPQQFLYLALGRGGWGRGGCGGKGGGGEDTHLSIHIDKKTTF